MARRKVTNAPTGQLSLAPDHNPPSKRGLPSPSLIDAVEIQVVDSLAENIADFVGTSNSNGHIVRSAFAIGTSRGSRKDNQDRAAVGTWSDSRGPLSVAIVSDGIGGLEYGAACATWTVAYVLAAMRSLTGKGDAALLEAAAAIANHQVFRRFAGRGGATLVCLLLRPRTCEIVHAGDSRAYISNSASGKLERVTEDDTMAEKFGKKRGLDESLRRSRSLLQFVGMGRDFQPHLQSIVRPEYAILASDGIAVIDDSMISDIVMHGRSERREVYRLLRITEWLGGRDNATAISVETENWPEGADRRHESMTIATPDSQLEIQRIRTTQRDAPNKERPTPSSQRQPQKKKGAIVDRPALRMDQE